MIAPASPEPKKPTRNDGVSVDGQGPATQQNGEGQFADFHPGLLSRGMRWGIGRRKRRRVVEQLAQWVENADPKTSIAACRALIAADAINVKREQGPAQTTVAVGVSVAMSQSVETALHEPEYLDWLESRGDSHTVRTAGNGGPVSDSPPPASN